LGLAEQKTPNFDCLIIETTMALNQVVRKIQKYQNDRIGNNNIET